MRNWMLRSWPWLVPGLLAFVVNLNVLQNGFVWDDNYIRSGQEASSLGLDLSHGLGKVYYRPVVSWFWIIDGTLWGDNPIGYHLTNLILHVAVTLLVSIIACQLFWTHPNKRWIVLLTGTLFAVHPVHAEAVAWVAGRNDLLPAFFLLMAFGSYQRYREKSNPAWLPLWAISLVLALLSKESALPLLLIFPLYDLLLWKKSGTPWKKLLTPSTFLVIILALGYLEFRHVLLGSPIGDAGLQKDPVLALPQTFFYAVGFYVKHLLVPYPLNAFIALPKALSAFDIMIVLVGFVSIGLFLRMMIWPKTRQLSLGFWVIGLGLSAPLLVAVMDFTPAPLAERYLYMPSIGFVFVVAITCVEAGQWIKGRFSSDLGFHVFIGLVCLLVLFFMLTTFDRNQVWQSDELLWKDTVIKSPVASTPHVLLGLTYKHQGKYAEAKDEFQRALQSDGNPRDYSMAANNMGTIYYDEKRFDLAEKAFVAAMRFDSSLYLSHHNLGVIYWEASQVSRKIADRDRGKKLLREARKHLIQAVGTNPTYSDSFYTLGLVNLELGLSARARRSFERVVELDPSSPLAERAAKMLAEGSR